MISTKPNLLKFIGFVLLITLLLSTIGCSSSSLSVGQKLYMSDGTEFGTIVQLDDAREFPNGAVEPGALVDFSPRIPGESSWLPQRSAETMVQ